MFSGSIVSDSFVTPWTVASKAPLSMEFSRQVYWNGLPFPTPGNLPDPGFKPVSPASAGRFFTIEPLEKFPTDYLDCINFFFVLLFRENFYLNTL